MSGALRIVIVEDDVLQVRLLRRFVERLGHEVAATATSIDEGLRVVSCEDFHGAIIDVDLSGEESEPIASLLTDRGLPFVVLTGFRELAVRGPTLRGARRLSKPLEPEQLEAEIARFVAGPP